MNKVCEEIVIESAGNDVKKQIAEAKQLVSLTVLQTMAVHKLLAGDADKMNWAEVLQLIDNVINNCKRLRVKLNTAKLNRQKGDTL